MSAQRLVRILTTRSGPDIEIALALENGQTLRVVATPDQADRLVDELEDILNAPEEPDETTPAA